MALMTKRNVKIGGIDASLFWGDPAEIKAYLREEDQRSHLAKPIAERLLAALAMVRRHKHRDD
jgi:hypothetical protein